jgi:hypothetical protein
MDDNTYLHGCPFAPGTPEKVTVLEARAHCRMPLFLRGDAVDFRRASRGGHGRQCKLKRPELWSRRFAIASAIQQGETYRHCAARLACSVHLLHQIVERVRQEMRLHTC